MLRARTVAELRHLGLQSFREGREARCSSEHIRDLLETL